MSEADRRIAEHIAQTVIARAIDALKDKELAAKVMDVWGGEIDRTIGRGLRRLGFYVVIALIGIASAKLGLLDLVLRGLTGGKP
jgi:lactate dehydrogenase-like 2-hydroxyacid dehydrogenase